MQGPAYSICALTKEFWEFSLAETIDYSKKGGLTDAGKISKALYVVILHHIVNFIAVCRGNI